MSKSLLIPLNLDQSASKCKINNYNPSIIDNFNIKNTNKVIKAINQRISDLQNINSEVHLTDLMINEYTQKIQNKKINLNKRKEEILYEEKLLEEKYKLLIEKSEINQDYNKNEIRSTMMTMSEVTDEIPKEMLQEINHLKDEINSKMNIVDLKQKEIEEKENKLNEVLNKLSEEDKILYQNYEDEFLNTNSEKNKLENKQNKIEIFDNIIQDIKSNLTKLKTSNSAENLLIENILKNEIENEKNSKISKNSKIKHIKEMTNQTGRIIDPTLDDISQIHDIEILNNKDLLLTEGLVSNYSLTKANEQTRIMKTHFDKHNSQSSLTYSIPESKFDKVESSSSLLDGMRSNRTFYLTKQKRIKQMMNSSLEMKMSDIGGEHACSKLKRNYEVNITNTNHKMNLRTSSNDRSSSQPNTSMNSSMRKNLMKDIKNLSIREEKEPNEFLNREKEWKNNFNKKSDKNEKLAKEENYNNNINNVNNVNNINPVKKSNKYSHIQSRLFEKVKTFQNEKLEDLRQKFTERTNIRTTSLTPIIEKKTTTKINSTNVKNSNNSANLNTSSQVKSRSVIKTKK